MSDSLHELQHTRPPCPSPAPRVYPNSCPFSQWCHPAISSSVVPFSSCPQSLPASGSFPVSQLFASAGQSTGVSASASVFPMNTQDWSPLGWTGWISLQSKGFSRVFSNTTVQNASSVHLSSVAQSGPTLCDPMNCSMPGLPVHHQLLEFTQTSSIESMMPSSHLILCRPLLLLPAIPPSIRVFSNESTLRMRWPKYWSFSFSIIPSKEIPGTNVKSLCCIPETNIMLYVIRWGFPWWSSSEDSGFPKQAVRVQSLFTELRSRGLPIPLNVLTP